jgi:hypothetical protein
MTKPIHTPGPLRLLYAARSISIIRSGFVETIARCEMESTRPMDETGANARLLAAAYNAFDSAARALGCNAVQLAEAMQEGVLLAEILGNADAILYHTPHLDKEAFGRVEAALAKVKGGAS